MGGVRTNYTGESPTLKGLFAAGESACWDMHGFNRLGGNSLAETLVMGMVVGARVADYVKGAVIDFSPPLVSDVIRVQEQRVKNLLTSKGKENVFDLRKQM